ncbi:MAG: M20/M25/M40 family metallo-hydrolase [Ignavibacteria bacterium]|nr:M20/M25/M40 family metallo-hydrolase [Ignavibacteria bacterium]
MKLKFLFVVLVVTSSFRDVVVAQSQEKIDTAVISKIKDEGMNRSQVMELLSYLTDIYGPRLTGSPEYNKAAQWAKEKLTSMGIENAHLEAWGPFGRGWTLKKFSLSMLEPKTLPLIAYPKAWSPATQGTISGDVLYLDAAIDSTFEHYKGKLQGKFVLFSDARSIKAHFEAEASRETDSSLLALANADMPQQSQRRFEQTPEQKLRARYNFNKWKMCIEEGALAVLESNRGDGGNIFVQGANVPNHPDTPSTRSLRVYSEKAKTLPQVVLSAEQYNRILRMIKKGERVRLELNLDVAFTKEDSSYNIIGEIPGTDLQNEIVMLGAHFDSWHGGTGATDNATGSAVCMEAMRILKTLDVKPRRTIRLGLWGGEEQGLLGSQAYVKKHFGTKFNDSTGKEVTSLFEQKTTVQLKPDAEKFSVYFNNDNGSGKVRGVYMQGNEATRPIFREWLKPFYSMEASTLTLSNTGGTDHLSFDAIGLPGFQFIQDELEYFTRTHHSTMDVFERVQEEDLKQASIVMAAFVYNAAMRDNKFPRKAFPISKPQGSN